MSDRTLLFHLGTGVKGREVKLFMDGESGTWRLFLLPHLACVDFTLVTLREFHSELSTTLQNIGSDPEKFNAEVRRERKE